MLYFYPAAFTPGCTKEAHNFAEATDKFKSLGATVIGVSYDNIDTLNKFSVSECRNKFAVASDGDQKIMKAYDAVLTGKPEWANRTSYVIAPTGEVLYAYTDLNPDKHVANTMAAVQKWADALLEERPRNRPLVRAPQAPRRPFPGRPMRSEPPGDPGFPFPASTLPARTVSATSAPGP